MGSWVSRFGVDTWNIFNFFLTPICNSVVFDVIEGACMHFRNVTPIFRLLSRRWG